MGEVVLEMVPMAPAEEASQSEVAIRSNAYTGWRTSTRSEEMEEARPGAAQRPVGLGRRDHARGSGAHAHGGGNEDDEDEDDRVVIIDNLHKTYLLGVEGVAALRGVSVCLRVFVRM